MVRGGRMWRGAGGSGRVAEPPRVRRRELRLEQKSVVVGSGGGGCAIGQAASSASWRAGSCRGV